MPAEVVFRRYRREYVTPNATNPTAQVVGYTIAHALNARQSSVGAQKRDPMTAFAGCPGVVVARATSTCDGGPTEAA
jgi:hypothetical protein